MVLNMKMKIKICQLLLENKHSIGHKETYGSLPGDKEMWNGE